MTDRELLEAAARAALMWKEAFSLDDEWNPIWGDEKGFYLGWGAGWWNPLHDDGDALRLAVKLKLTPHIDGNMTDCEDCTEAHLGDPCAATRRAIVRAAAAIGTEAHAQNQPKTTHDGSVV